MPTGQIPENEIPEKKLILSWEQFHRDARQLAVLLQPSGPFAALIAITRGGLAPAAIIACELDIRRIETISIASYKAETVRGEASIVKPIAPDVLHLADSANVLVIDDLADSGETIKIVRTILPKAHVAVLYVKPLGRPLADTFVMEVPQDTWIYFPWDLGAP